MNIIAAPAAATAAAHIATPALGAPTRTEAILQTAHLLLTSLEGGRPISTNVLGSAMSSCFGGTDAEGYWIWKDAYEALEVAQVLFIRKFGAAILSRSASSDAALAMLKKVAQLVPTHTRRSQESQAMQQLSTPLPLAFVVARAGAIASSDLVLEPSAGTGLLAVHAEIARASLTLNELAATRADLLDVLFPGAARYRHDAAHIDDHLDAGVKPSVVLMNPPFTVGAFVDGRVADAGWRHLTSALARLQPGGRLVAITGADLSPDNSKWRSAFIRLQEKATVVFTAAIDGRVYARHGTTAETRLTIIDKLPAADPTRFAASPGQARDVETLLSWIGKLPPRTPGGYPDSIGALAGGVLRTAARRMAGRSVARFAPAGALASPAKVLRPARPVALHQERGTSVFRAFDRHLV